jgi:putative ABC transport system ATP-binding protein
MASAILMRNVSKRYRRSRDFVAVLDRFELDVPAGQFVALMGPSGAGKTTILNLIGGLDHIDSGEVVVAGRHIEQLSGSQLSQWRAAHTGFVFQSHYLLPMLSAAENVELPLLLTRQTRAERRDKVAAALHRIGLSDRADHKPGELSGGQQQRIGIARAIIADPPILLCDEPTGDLDRAMADDILGLLQSFSRENGKTIVMVTHDPLAAAYADRRLHFDKGMLTLATGDT